MGRLKSEQGQLFYQFQLGAAVPEDHLVRATALFIDGAGVHNRSGCGGSTHVPGTLPLELAAARSREAAAAERRHSRRPRPARAPAP
jgi:hypothetical protein